MQQYDVVTGEKDKYEEYYIKYKKMMYLTAFKILKNEELAEDAVHQSFLKIIESKKSIEDISDDRIKAYLSVVCKNASLDMLKKNKNIVDFNEQLENIPSSADVEEDTIKNLEFEIIIKKISSLPDIYKNILLLYYCNDFSIEEISKQLFISKELVYKRLQRGKAKIMEIGTNKKSGKADNNTHIIK